MIQTIRQSGNSKTTETVRRSVVTGSEGGGRAITQAQVVFRAGKGRYSFVQTHRMHNTKHES